MLYDFNNIIILKVYINFSYIFQFKSEFKMKMNHILKSVLFISSLLMILTYSLDIQNQNDNLK